MTGVVLCGGKSMRMGADKGLLQQKSLTWAELAAGKLAAFKIGVVLSVNEDQYPAYLKMSSKMTIIKDDSSLQVHGPLIGILSVHLRYPSEDLLVLACDLPKMEKIVIGQLIKISFGKTEDAFVFRNNEHNEPLCAVYTSKGLKKIFDQYKQGGLLKHSLHYVLDTLETCYLTIPEQWKKYFYNYNSPSDLNNL